MPPRRQLVLHIGAHRTATTSAQRFLNTNGKALLAQGVLYPYREPRHRVLMNDLFSGKLDPDDLAADLTRRANARPGTVETIVLSDEDVAMRRDLTALARLQDHFDVRILYTLRRQDLWLESWYFQNVKWQWNHQLAHLTFDDFLDRRAEFHWIHYDRFLTGVEALFGAEAVRLGVFESGQMPDGPVADLCRRIGIADLSDFTEPPHVNSSMSSEMVEFARHLPLDLLDERARHMLRQALATIDSEVLGNTGKQSERLLPSDRRAALMAEYADGNRAVARRHFDREALFLEPLPEDDSALARMEIPADSAALIEQIVAPLLLHMAQEMADLRKGPDGSPRPDA